MSQPNSIQIAEEAAFQLATMKNHLEWLAAIARAIVTNVQHCSGRDVAILAELAKFLDDTGMVDVDLAIDQFKSIIAISSAPQNAEIANRGAHLPTGADLAQRLVAARGYASLGQTELAKAVGIDQASISQIETGRTKRTAYVAEIARACGVDVNWLAFGSKVGQ